MLDQHFMIDTALLKRIVETAKLTKEETVLEIGAGKGALTREILKGNKSLTIIEKDPKLAKELQHKFPHCTTIQADATTITLPKATVCIANLPYTICEPLLWQFIRTEIERCILVIPKRFSKRLTGEIVSSLQILTETFYHIKTLEHIPPQAFDPQPKVESALITLTRRKEKTAMQDFLKQWDKKVKNAMQKTLTGQGKTKRQAEEEIQKNIQLQILEKSIKKVTFQELKHIQKFLANNK